MKQRISTLIRGVTVGLSAMALVAASLLLQPQKISAISSCPTDLLSGYTPTYTNYNDSSAVNVGVKFRVNGAPYIRGVKFYKGVDNTGTHVAHLRESGGGSDLASVTFTGESSSGWQTVNFSSDVPVQSQTDYIVWVSMPNGHYAVDPSGEPLSFNNTSFGGSSDVLNIAQGSSAYYSYTADDTVVPSNAVAHNYWVSPVAADSTAPTDVTSPTATDDAAGPIVDWNAAAEDSNGTYDSWPVLNEIYRSDGTTSQRIGVTANGATYWNGWSGTQQDVTARPGTTYTYTLKATDACGNVSTGATTSGLTTASQTLETLFNGATPQSTDTSTERQVVGMYWKSDVAGEVWGARIYRSASTMPPAGATNNEAVRAVLWDNNGTELAGQFLPIGNNQSGWIDVRFDAPVSVQANHEYVIGYYAGNGKVAYSNSTFSSVVDNGNNLSARADSVSTPNGVYAQGSGIDPYTFPTNRASNSTWYGIDVNFFEN